MSKKQKDNGFKEKSVQQEYDFLQKRIEKEIPGVKELVQVYGDYQAMVSYCQQYLNPIQRIAGLPTTNSTSERR